MKKLTFEKQFRKLFWKMKEGITYWTLIDEVFWTFVPGKISVVFPLVDEWDDSFWGHCYLIHMEKKKFFILRGESSSFDEFEEFLIRMGFKKVAIPCWDFCREESRNKCRYKLKRLYNPEAYHQEDECELEHAINVLVEEEGDIIYKQHKEWVAGLYDWYRNENYHGLRIDWSLVENIIEQYYKTDEEKEKFQEYFDDFIWSHIVDEVFDLLKDKFGMEFYQKGRMGATLWCTELDNKENFGFKDVRTMKTVYNASKYAMKMFYQLLNNEAEYYQEQIKKEVKQDEKENNESAIYNPAESEAACQISG